MIIEFTGLPGSGKTTISKQISNQKKLDLVKVRSKKEIIFFNVIFLLKYPVKFYRNFIEVLKDFENVHVLYYKMINFFLVVNAKYIKARRFKNTILDQGFSQNIISLYNNKLSEEEIKRIMENYKLADKLVLVNAEKSKRLKRIKQRGYGVRDTLKDYNAKKWLENSEYNYKIMIRVLSSLKIDYLIVDNNGELSDVIEKVKNF